MKVDERNIQVFQFFDFFNLPRPENDSDAHYFKTDDAVYEALDIVKNLPVVCVLEDIHINPCYKGFSRNYLRWKHDKENGILYLVPSEKGPYILDLTTQIDITEFKWASISYSEIYNGIEFNFITSQEFKFNYIFKLESHFRFVLDELRSHEVQGMSMKKLEDIYQLIHVEEYTWYEKSMIIHRIVLGEDCDLTKCSKDRPDKVNRWIEKMEESDWKSQEIIGDNGCGCDDFTLDVYIHKKSVFLSKTIQFLVESKKASFTAKAIMIFSAFHLFNGSYNNNKTKGCLRGYVRDLYNGTENGLNELVRLGWLDVHEYQDYEYCQSYCAMFEYHNCIDDYYHISNKFTLVGWFA